MRNDVMKNIFKAGRTIAKGMKRKPAMYTREWVNSVPRAEFDREREKLRLAAWAGDFVADTIRRKIDSYMIDKEWEEEYRKNPNLKNWGRVYYSEHGDHLESGDD